MNILIVDDETDSLAEIESYVKKYGQFDRCVVCTNALEALEQASKLPFDIALLDIEMPGINGMELAERLSSLFPKIAIAFITAYNHYAAEAFEVNALAYILKPVREDRLFKALYKLAANKLEKPPAETGEKESALSINMFRKFTVRRGDQLIKWNRKKSAELFAYLIDNREHPIHKDILCELFWPDFEPKKALVNLQTTIYSIRKALGIADHGQIRIDYAGSSYSLHLQEAISDVYRFERLLLEAYGLNDTTMLEQAIGLYSGDYLEEDGWLWAEPKKVLLERKYQLALQRLKQNKQG